MKRAMWLAVLAFVVGVVTFPSQAAIINVAPSEVAVSNNGLCSLREAILNAEAGGLVSGDCVAGSPGANAISLASNSIYVLPDQDPNHIDGEVNGLPEIHSQITINGNGATIKRDPALFTTTPCGGVLAKFRIFYVSGLGDLSLNSLTIQNGCADVGGVFGAGGAIFNRGTLSLDTVTVSNNEAFRSGGGIHNDGTLTLTQSTVSNNAVLATEAGGGGITNRGTMQVSQSTINGNKGAGAGGGVDTGMGNATFANSTVSSNVSEGDGGGIFSQSPSTNVVNSTVVLNRGTNSVAAGLGSGIYVGSGTTSAGNSLIAQQANGANCFGLTGGGSSLADDSTCVGATFNATPMIGPLANNGGPTQTHALLLGSPAIDAADNTTANAPPVNAVDQRGVSRPQGAGSDIGAFEFAVPTVSTPVVNPTSTSEGTGTSFSVSGTFTDPEGALDQPFTAVVNWGDSTTSTAAVSGSGNPFNYTFSGSHTYAQSGSYNITVSVTNTDGGTGTSAAISVSVANVAPTVGTPIVSPSSANQNVSTAFSVSGTFTDPAGALDQPFTAVVNWGDSTTSAATVSGSANPFSYSFNGNHTYPTAGPFNVTVSVTDKDGGTGTSAPASLTAGPADLLITKTASGAFFASNPATYNIVVTNSGPNDAASVVVTDVLPAGATFVSATPTQGSCTGTTTVTCTLGAIANGGTAMITLKVTPSTEGPLSNTASVSAAPQSDPNPANNSSTATVTVLATASIPVLSELMLVLLAVLLAAIALRK